MNRLRARLVHRLFALLLLLPLTAPAHGQLTGTLNFLVLRVQFHDMTGASFTDAQTQTMFDSIKTLWGTNSAYGAMTQNFRLTSLYKVPQNTSVYVDVGGSSSSGTAYNALVADAVANAPSGTDFSNLTGLIVLFADNRPGGFYRGITFVGVTVTPPGGGSISLPVSVVGEDPNEGTPTNWGRIAHEIGHEMQQNSPPHPSNYHSSFEQMDAEYPAQTGMFEKQATRGFPGWMPPAKYVTVNANQGAVVTLLAEEASPGSEPDIQGAKAFLSFGGTSVYYMVSARRRRDGDDIATTSPLVSPTDCVAAATPNGIPDCGVLIERVVENGDPNVQDCDPQFGCTNRWVDVLGKGNNASSLWHEGDVYTASSYGNASVKKDGISIVVLKQLDPDHYQVAIRYDDASGAAPDVGLESWLQPPGNTYETTDIWVDSPLNGYASPPDSDALHYRYGVHADLRGGVVPIGNGDNPGVGQVNRIYARIRNYGTQPAANVKVFFDVTNPPGVGINGSNGFQQIGSVDSGSFSGLTSIPPGGHVDVFLPWTPNFPLTPQQIADGQFFFHTCVRIRVSHVAGETFFANQDGDGQQENILYFDATGAGGSPGAPGAANKTVIHLRNDSPSQPKSFMLGVLRNTLPPGWDVIVNGGQNLVQLAPGVEKDVPVSIKQNVAEPIGSSHQVKVIASSIFSFTNPAHPTPHDEARQLGGVTFEVNVVRKTKVTCRLQSGQVVGTVTGLDPRDQKEQASVAVVLVNQSGNSIRLSDHLVLAPLREGRFTVRPREHGRGVCLYAGSTTSSASGSAPFGM
jgi:hypothetical protein